MLRRAGGQIALVVNADAYGHCACVSRGTLDAAGRDIATTTGIVANSPHFDEQVAWLGDHPTLDLGAPLNLTDRMPLTQVMSRRLARWGGRFPGKSAKAPR